MYPGPVYSSDSRHRKVAIFAPDVADIQTLIEDLPADVLCHVLPPGRDPLAEVASCLAGYQDLEALYLVAHGEPGRIFRGQDAVVTQTLAERAPLLAEIGSALAIDAPVYLCSCRVAYGAEGRRFVDGLAAEIGRNVVASESILGRVGDSVQWGMSYVTGSLPVPAPPFYSQTYAHGLNIPADEDFNDELNPTLFLARYDFTHDGITYQITGDFGPYNSRITDFDPLFTGISGPGDLALVFDTDQFGGISQIQVGIGGGTFDLESIAFSAVAGGDVTLASSGVGKVSWASNGIPASRGPVDLSSDPTFQNITHFSFSGFNLALILDDIIFGASSNSAPSASGAPTDVSVTEDTQSNVDLSAMSFADVDGDTLVVTLDASAGTFAAPADGSGVGGGVTAALVSATQITLAGAAGDIATYLDTASNIQYTPDANVSGQDQATITVSATDGNGGNLASDPVINIDVTAVNDAPVFTGLDGTPAFTEGGTAVVLDSDVTVSDVELGSLNGGNGNFAGASLTAVRSGSANANDQFSMHSGGNLVVAGSSISAGGNVIASLDTSTPGQALISFQNNGTVPTTALVNEVMQALRYSNGSNDPAASVQLDWTFSDGNAGDAQGTGDNPGTVTGSMTVSINNINDAPILTATGDNPTYLEGSLASDLYSAPTASVVENTNTIDRFAAMTLTVTNLSDGASEILRLDDSDVSLTDGNTVNTATNGLTVHVAVTNSTATVSFSGAALTEAQMQTLVDGMSYRNTSDNPTTAASRVVTITSISDDGGTAGGGQDSATPNLSSTVSLSGVNDPPVIGNLSGETSTVTVGSSAANLTTFDEATVTNADSIDYDGGFLRISQNSGAANGSWGLDGITATSGGDAIIAAGETVIIGGVSVGTVHALDDGQGGNALRLDLNASADNARVQTLLQNLQWSAAAGTGEQTFTATLDDGDGTANGGDPDTTASFTMMLINQPAIANLDGDSVTFTENDTIAALDSGSNAALSDGDAGAYDGGNLTATVSANQVAAQDILTLDVSGTVSLAGTSAGSNVSVGGTVIGTLANNIAPGNDLVVNFNSNATETRVQDLIRAASYSNNSESPDTTARTVALTVTDNDGLTSATQRVTVNVTAVNDAPTASDHTVSTDEDTNHTFASAAFPFSDVDGDGLQSVRIDALPATGTLFVDGNDDDTYQSGEALANGDSVTVNNITAGHLQYAPPADQNGAGLAAFTFSVSDGTDFAAAPSTMTIDVTAVNDAPTASDNTVTTDENTNHAFASAAFPFSDVDAGDSLQSVRIDALPATGTLFVDGNDDDTYQSGEALANGDSVTVSDITAGHLQYAPPANQNGAGLASFTFSVSDGTDFAAAPSTMTINVTAAPPPPTPPEPPPPAEPPPPPAPDPDDNASPGVQTLDRGPVRVVVIETSAGTVILSGSKVVSGAALDAILGTYDRGNSPLAQSYRKAIANMVEDPVAALKEAAADPRVRQTLSELSGDTRISDDNEWGSVSLESILSASEKPTFTEQTEGGEVTRTIETGNGVDSVAVVDGSSEGGQSRVSARLPDGVGLSASGPTQPASNADALRSQLSSDSSAEQDADNRAEINKAIDEYVGKVGGNASDVVTRRVTFSASEGTTTSGRVNLTGSPDSQEAMVIDVSNLPSGTVINLDNVDFVVFVGGSGISGGKGNQTVVGDGNGQYIVQGPGDDTIRGGGGDDTVASLGGEDQLFGGTGNDHVVGGADNDTLEGGPGNDVLQGGASDQGTWRFALSEGELISYFTVAKPYLTDPAGFERDGPWQQEGHPGAQSDPRLLFADEAPARLQLVATLYKAATGELPSLGEFNDYATSKHDQRTLAELAVEHFFQAQGVADQTPQVQVPLLIEAVWGEHGDHDALVAEGLALLDNGGSWGEAMLHLARAAQSEDLLREGIEDGDLVLIRPFETSETGWSSQTGDDILRGGEGNDRLVGGDGSDWLDGGEGTDVAVFTGSPDDYVFRAGTGEDGRAQFELVHSITGETDTLLDVEMLEIGGRFYGPSERLASAAADTDYALSDYLVELTGQAVQTMELMT